MDGMISPHKYLSVSRYIAATAVGVKWQMANSWILFYDNRKSLFFLFVVSGVLCAYVLWLDMLSTCRMNFDVAKCMALHHLLHFWHFGGIENLYRLPAEKKKRKKRRIKLASFWIRMCHAVNCRLPSYYIIRRSSVTHTFQLRFGTFRTSTCIRVGACVSTRISTHLIWFCLFVAFVGSVWRTGGMSAKPYGKFNHQNDKK